MIDTESHIYSALNFIIICSMFVILVLLIMPHQNGVSFGRLEKVGTYCKGTVTEAYNYDYYKCIPSPSGMGCVYEDNIYMKSFFIPNGTCTLNPSGTTFITMEDTDYYVLPSYPISSAPFTINYPDDCIATKYIPNEGSKGDKHVRVLKQKCVNLSGSNFNTCVIGPTVYIVNDIVCTITPIK